MDWKGVALLAVLLTVSVLSLTKLTSVDGASTGTANRHRRAPMLIDLCPISCMCDVTVRTVSCNASYTEFSFRTFTVWTVWRLLQLKLFGGLRQIPEENLPDLLHLDLSHNNISSLKNGSFLGAKNLNTLDLSYNQILTVQKLAFSGLFQLKVLDLTGNSLVSLNSDVFMGLDQLEVLNLGRNAFSLFPSDVFHPLLNLRTLDLGHNRIYHINSELLNNLTLIRNVNVSYNLFNSVSQAVMRDLLVADVIGISGNSFKCSCAIDALIQAVHKFPDKFLNISKITCTDIESFKERSVTSMRTDDLHCTMPNISYITKELDILYQGAVQLTCLVTGDPSPVVMWRTPWNHTFAHGSVHHLLADIFPEEKFVNIRHYQGVSLSLITEVSTDTDGSLYIDKFRGYFVGNYTCIALSPLGFVNSTVSVAIHSSFPNIYLVSQIFGAGCAVAMLVAAAIVSIIRLCVLKVCKCRKPKTDVEKVEEEEEEEEEVSEVGSESEETKGSSCGDFYDDDPSPPDTPPCSVVNSSEESPEKCTTPNGEAADKWISGNIMETLDEVKWRLRYGVERKMEKVRCQVQSMRESGSVYFQTIKESSSEAATKVKHGVVMGVEQVKYGVQSMKEFCGTGNMGGQTISTISVSTDVDTQQQTSVTKAVTYV